MIYYEHRPTKIRQGPPRLVTREELDQRRGFRSVYGWPTEAADHVRTTGSSAGLKWFPVYSDELLLDFDDRPHDANVAITLMAEYGYAFSWWESGGRSVHLHIKIEPMLGSNVPASQKQFVAATFPGADLAFYHAAGMYRLPGTAHEKNPGHYKRMVEEFRGRPLAIPLINQPLFRPSASGGSQRDPADLDAILTHMLFKTVHEGEGRNKHAYNMAKLLKDLGHDYARALDVVEGWSGDFAVPPISRTELEATVRSAYR
jgi:hypothetical protein